MSGSSFTGKMARAGVVTAIATVFLGLIPAVTLAAQASSARVPLRGSLSTVWCEGPSFCIATGQYSVPGHSGAQLVEKWNGKTWQIESWRDFGIVSCESGSFCLGTISRHLVTWNGHDWKNVKVKPPALSSFFMCESASFCLVIGSSQTQLLGWNGKSWADMPGGACDYGPDCSWHGVFCGSATNCYANGTACQDGDCDSTVDYDVTWNGHEWDQTPGTFDAVARRPSTFYNVPSRDCTGASFCMRTSPPASASFTRDWGNTWQDASPNLTTACHGLPNCVLSGYLSCGTTWSCLLMPVFDAQVPGQLQVSLAWNGSTWTAAAAAKIDGRIPRLNSLSCGSARSCVVVGSFNRTKNSYMRPVAERWNGKTWQVTAVPVP